MTKEGVAEFPPLLLGKPLPIEAGSGTSSKRSSRTPTPSSKNKAGGKGAPPVSAAKEDDAEEEPVFAGGTYTLRFSCDGVPLISMKLNVIGADGSGGKKGKK